MVDGTTAFVSLEEKDYAQLRSVIEAQGRISIQDIKMELKRIQSEK